MVFESLKDKVKENLKEDKVKENLKEDNNVN